MNKFHITFLVVSFFVLLVSCNRSSPQMPSNKGNSTDRKTVTLLSINENLIKKEDAYLKKYALLKDNAFKKNDIGFWYKIDKSGNGSKIKDSVVCNFTYKLFSLNGKELQNDSKQIIIGKKQVVYGLEEGLKLMNKGDSATFIIPWYLAYGMKGNAPIIPPYTSIIFRVKISH